jgi:hypothetical protein
MKCRACGREMLNKDTYFECSNFFCDYEEDVKNQKVSIKQEAVSPSMFLFKSTTMTRTVASEVYVVP